EQHNFAVWEASGCNAREEVAADTGRAVKHAVLINEAVVGCGVANLCVIGVAAERARVTVGEEAGASAPHEINVAFEVAVADISLAIYLQSVLEAVEVNVGDDRARGLSAVENDRFGLTATLGRGVVQGE